jgi:guanylate kinase
LKNSGLCKGSVIILSGPSGAGKTTLHDLLLKQPGFSGRIVRSISATTRKPRGTEKNGRDYLFISPKMFEARIRRGQFLEWAKVFDNYYGTPLSAVRAVLEQGRHVLLCIDVQGGCQVKRLMPEAIAIFIKTPSLKELRRRLEARATDSGESIILRLKTAREELKCASKYDHVLVNDTLESAMLKLARILGRHGIRG